MIIMEPTWYCGGHIRVGSERGKGTTLEGEGGDGNRKRKTKRGGIMKVCSGHVRLNLVKWAPLLNAHHSPFLYHLQTGLPLRLNRAWLYSFSVFNKSLCFQEDAERPLARTAHPQRWLHWPPPPIHPESWCTWCFPVLQGQLSPSPYTSSFTLRSFPPITEAGQPQPTGQSSQQSMM